MYSADLCEAVLGQTRRSYSLELVMTNISSKLSSHMLPVAEHRIQQFTETLAVNHLLSQSNFVS
jgi:hypothetical protein